LTCIAWDGKTIAADRMASNGNTKREMRKLQRLANGGVATFSGLTASGRRLVHWYEGGASIETWPELGEEYVCLVIFDREGLKFYESAPFPERIEGEFWAFGSGRDFAIAAMACGKSATEAVEIACRFDNGCGMGVDSMELVK
jgi:ATP-dependent protease HslVU (ClpYQ) peptidase subunit